ncbi:MAG: MarR family transcriptional regulator [Beijerinckiaceae bacterium]
MSVELRHSHALHLLHDVALQQVRDGGHDLSNRQLAILMTIYLDIPPHTVRGLAQKLNVTKPVITRALDAMGEMDLVARRRDPADKRNVIVQRTVQGSLYLEKLGDLVITKAKELPL